MHPSIWLYMTAAMVVCTSTKYNTTIAIVATNDIHGAALPTDMQRSDNGQKYTYGGLEYMGSLIEIIRK